MIRWATAYPGSSFRFVSLTRRYPVGALHERARFIRVPLPPMHTAPTRGEFMRAEAQRLQAKMWHAVLMQQLEAKCSFVPAGFLERGASA